MQVYNGATTISGEEEPPFRRLGTFLGRWALGRCDEVRTWATRSAPPRAREHPDRQLRSRDSPVWLGFVGFLHVLPQGIYRFGLVPLARGIKACVTTTFTQILPFVGVCASCVLVEGSDPFEK